MQSFRATVKLRWRPTTRLNPCPSCGRAGWCQVAENGLVMCRHVHQPGSTLRTDKHGDPYCLWHPDGGGVTSSTRPRPQPDPFRRVPAELLDRIYRVFLSRLPLSHSHREGLQRRGLSDETIARSCYRSMPGRERIGIACRLADLFGGELLEVPGFFLNDLDPSRAFPSIAGRGPGILLPVRDPQDRIVALKIRLDKPEDEGRYRWFTSKSRGGPGPGTPAHTPTGTPANAQTLRITEGVLKADVAFALSSVPTIGVPGVGLWRACLPCLLALRPEAVMLAWDADWERKEQVRRPLVEMARLLLSSGFRVGIEMWDEADGKGIDDLLAAGLLSEVRWLEGGRQ